MTIDWWTLGIQAVNVVILVWLLARFFWRPVAAMIEQRRVKAQQILAEAEATHREATDAMTGIEQTRAGFGQEREAILTAAHQEAERARTALLAQAQQEAAATREAAQTAIEREREASLRAWSERANRLAVDIAGRLAARLSGPTVSAAFLDGLLREIRLLPDSVRGDAIGNGGVLEAVSAVPIDPDEQARYRTRIGEAFAEPPPIAFKVEPDLIAGLELRGPHLVIHNSWRADLDRILAELAHDD